MPSSPAARLAVFDLDGTILDTMADLTNSLNYGLAVHGFPPAHDRRGLPLCRQRDAPPC